MTRRRLDDTFLSEVARQYSEHVQAGRMPAPPIAEAERAPVPTVHRWIHEARKRGLIPVTTQGLPSAPVRSQGSAGKNVRENVRRLRESHGMTYAELSDHLHNAGCPIAVLGLQRIETGTRRVDVDDLVALAEVFGVEPASLLWGES
ncbi:helix-turn-helix domain-containing protein [Streptomyces echinatus]|uniref:helix-turn-helix domain-containing protein n=1 Tax=Streptomyces echinatus TaxID=67293 RepID=UPI0037B88998